MNRFFLFFSYILSALGLCAQVDTEQLIRIGRNALYYEDYVLSIQYFNKVIQVKPYLAQPYFYRAVAKLNLEDYLGAEADASLAIERNPFITDAYEVRGVARQNMGNAAGAVEDYDYVLKGLPDNKGLLFNRALALEQLKQYEESLETFNRLIKLNPKFDTGYMARGRLNLEMGDTINAVADAKQAIEINPSGANAYIILADVAMHQTPPNYKEALDAMDNAIKYEPRYTGNYINRSFLRYHENDYFGAMADLDYALELDPTNYVAHYNRALLRLEVRDFNRAIEDLDFVLKVDPDDTRALFNRALLYRETGNLDAGIKDLNRLIEIFPDFSAAFFMRYEMYEAKGNHARAQKDLDKSIALGRKKIKHNPLNDIANYKPSEELSASDEEHVETQDEVRQRFSELLTINTSEATADEQVYNSNEIRGKVQERNVNVELEPMLELSYYVEPTELKTTSTYVSEIDQLNASGVLKFNLDISNGSKSNINEEAFAAHQQSIVDFTENIEKGNPRAVDYFGRAMDKITLRDYDGAEADFSKAINITPDFAIAYLGRAAARMHAASLTSDITETLGTPAVSNMRLINEDLDTFIKLVPQLPLAYYNKGVVLAMIGDMTSALSAFNKAIELNPEFGEAFYNRGYVYLRLGDKVQGIADLSHAGELGIVPSYNILKRMR